MIISKRFNAIKRLSLLATAVALASCATTPTPEAPGLTPASNGDIDLMLARFANAVHLIADLNENGEATYQELLRVDADADDEKFRIYDADKSGGLSLQEATTAITNGESAAKLRAQFDPNNDGNIDTMEAAEFDRMIGATEGLRRFFEVEHIFNL